MRFDRAVICLAIGETLIWASVYYVFPALLLRWEVDLGWTKAELTAAITMSILASAIVSPLAGGAIDRGMGAPLMGFSAVLGGCGLYLLGGVGELWQFYCVWLVIGVAMSGCLYEPCFALITRSRGVDARHAIIVVTLVAGFASTISFPVTYELAEAVGWRSAVRYIAAIVIFLVAPILWYGGHLLEVNRVKNSKQALKTESSIVFVRTPVFWCLAIGFACFAFVHGAVLHHFLPMLDKLGLSMRTAVVAASLIGPMQVVGRLAMTASGRYLSNYGVAIAAYVALGLSIVALLLSGFFPAFLSVFVILFGSAFGAVSILRPLLALEILGETSFGAKTGALALLYLSGSASAPFVGSLIWNIGGYDLVLGTLLAVTAIGFILYHNAYRLTLVA